MIDIIIGSVVVLLIILAVMRHTYCSRGKKALKDLNFNIWPVSNTRYMNVENNNVVNYECWYYRENENSRLIQVTGKVDVEYPSFAKKYELKAEISVRDLDLNDDFSFRPDGYNTDGTRREGGSSNWHPLTLGADGSFDTSVIAYVSGKNKPDFTHDNILDLGVAIRVSLVDKHGTAVASIPEQSHRYRFIVRPEIANKDLWMSFDPGTSGSCVAFGCGGLLDQTDNIRLAYNVETDMKTGTERKSPIFHSRVKIRDNAGFFKDVPVEELVPFDETTNEGDFFFGNIADKLDRRNSFQSIKKLLGYNNGLEVENIAGPVKKIKGEDLAYLLVKGLCQELCNSLKADTEVRPEVKKRLLSPEGKLTPSRAIVAVPNNYTVAKVQAMVNTVKRTGLFKEVHYIYEAEGVMMYYLNLNWARLAEVQNKVFVVFDMGGATINATAFRIRLSTGKNRRGMTNNNGVEVDTVSRVGYSVGGDNIDYALIKVIYGMPSMVQALAQAGIKADEHRRRNKKALITFVNRLKLDYIRANMLANSAAETTEDSFFSRLMSRFTGNSASKPAFIDDGMASNSDIFWTNLFNEAKNWGLTLPAAMPDSDLNYLKMEGVSDTSAMNKLVMESIRDAVGELLYGMSGMDVELILSGRSVLYPRVKEIVKSAIERGGNTVSEWNYEGASEDHDEAVKTAVVRGACWYAMNSRFVTLLHNKLTSTFGYIDLVNNQSKFVEVLPKNTAFDENGVAEREVEPYFPCMTSVEFVQMLGRDYDTIYGSRPENRIFHKMNSLGALTEGIVGNIHKIKIRVDHNNNFSCEVCVAGLSTPVLDNKQAADTDICDSNSEAYTFAALSSLDDNKGSTDNPVGPATDSETPAGPVRAAAKPETPYRPEAPKLKKRRF